MAVMTKDYHVINRYCIDVIINMSGIQRKMMMMMNDAKFKFVI
jgi:hypothetical protein